MYASKRLIFPLFVLPLFLFSLSADFTKKSISDDPEIQTHDVPGLPFPFRFNVDYTSASYRTGVIDPAIAQVPVKIQTGMLSQPQKYIKQLASFLKNDGGSAGKAKDQYHLVKRIHDWITDNLAYDSYLLCGIEGWEGSRYPESFLKYETGPRTTCGGFARLFPSKMRGVNLFIPE